MEIETSSEMLSLADYSERAGVNARTVKRWLASDELPGAIKDPFTGAWRIPATATRMVQARTDGPAGGFGSEMAVHDAATAAAGGLDAGALVQLMAAMNANRAEAEPTRLDDLEELPAMLTVAQAAEFLGVPQAQILAHRDVFKVMDVGVNASPRVPKSTIYAFEGRI